MAVIDDVEAPIQQPQMTAKLFEMVKVTDLTSMKCGKCEKTFMTEDALNKHKSQHVKIRPKKEKNKLLAAEKARKKMELETKK